MPTGYTAPVADGKITTLREFALSCARGMGALIMMRDDPMDAPIPERFEPRTSYHDERILAAERILAELADLSDEECTARASAEYEAKVAERREYAAGKDQQRARYEAMLAQVHAWDCGAEGLKPFMIDQLQSSMAQDGGDLEWWPEPALQSGSEWRRDTAAGAAKDLGYHTEQRAQEIARTGARNLWLKALRDSLSDAAVTLEPST